MEFIYNILFFYTGTTYLTESNRPVEYRFKKYDPVLNVTLVSADFTYMHTDNDGRNSPCYTEIREDGRWSYELDELELTASARLRIMLVNETDASEIKAVIHKFIGDRTGILHMYDGQQVWIEYVESKSNKTEAPCSFLIDAGAEAIMPSETHLHGVYTKFAGLVTGINSLFIEDLAVVEFYSTGHTSAYENGAHINTMDEGNFLWDTFHVKKGGKAGFLHIGNELKVNTSEIKVKYHGNLYMNEAMISCTYGWIESEGVLHLDGHGYGAESGPGAGRTVDGYGYGASHGGYGGGQDVDQAEEVEPYDSVHRL